MPATEQTWRSSKLLHAVFGITSLAMLVTTLWMLGADHKREWKNYQRKFRDVETWTAQSRIDEQETNDYDQKKKSLESELRQAQLAPVDDGLINAFLVEARSIPKLPGEPDRPRSDLNGYDLKAIESAKNEFESASAKTEADQNNKVAKHERLIAALKAVIGRAKLDEDNRSRKLKFKRADLDAERSTYSLAVDNAADPDSLASLQRINDRLKKEADQLNEAAQAAKTHRLALESILADIAARENAARKALADHDGVLARLQKARYERAPNWGKTILELPIIDAFGRPLKVDQVWLPQLTLNNNFRDNARFDRCITCHQGIDKTAPGSAIDPGYNPVELVALTLPTPSAADAALGRALGMQLDAQTNDKAVVSSVAAGSAASQAGLLAGDVIQVKKPEPPAKDKPKDAKAPAASEKKTAEKKDEYATSRADVLALLNASAENAQVVRRVRSVGGKEQGDDIELKPSSESEVVRMAQALVAIYGLELSDHGLVNPEDVTVEVVWPRTLGAQAQLQAGDVLEFVTDAKITQKEHAYRTLLQSAKWGSPLKVTVRRGVPQPYSSHPRLDLFVGSLSPHKLGDVGCTICHEGQGFATAFKWASHTPNDPSQASDWAKEHGWFNNHHWILPMKPKRFAESMCLKCHHEVAELAPSERFPDPPAPKLMAGYELIRSYGCFGCHEINGFDGPSRRRGPDLRAEPPYFAAASQVLADKALTPRQRQLAEDVVAHPEQSQSRKLLAESILTAAHEAAGVVTPAGDKGKIAPKLSAATIKMAGILGADDETPGQYRKVGPSLRHVASKVDLPFLYSWIKDPMDFRPTTKMPKFFGLWDHLVNEPRFEDDKVKIETSKGRIDAERFEPLEIRAISEYLLSASQPFDYIEPPKGATGDAARGKLLFETRGCLACHQHVEFPKAHESQGPDLSRIGAKLTTANGKKWLYSWVREPNRYHTRTVMPNLFLGPNDGTSTKAGEDSALDITAYLLSTQSLKDSQKWSPAKLPNVDEASLKSLDELVSLYLSGAFTKRETEQYVKSGIPADRAEGLKGDEAVLVSDKGTSADQLAQKKMLYLGRKTITRLGCSGCHDIPGYEDAKPIGTGLADWGRKETSKLDFAQIIPYLTEKLSHHGHGDEEAEAGDEHGHGISLKNMSPQEGYFMGSLEHHEREGFIWQKLSEPRSYDYKKTENKDYTDRLRMPKFNFTGDQKEAVITFVLGLVAEPPAAKYVYKPSPRQLAIQKGEQVLEKFNCIGCHTVGLEKWEIDYKPFDAKNPAAIGSLPPPAPFEDFPFLKPYFSPEAIEASKKVDRRGMGHALIEGEPKPEAEVDEDTGKKTYYFSLWKPAAIDGQVWPVGSRDVPVQEDFITKKYAPHGGSLARLLQPLVVAYAKANNPAVNVQASDAWGWVPPPLVGEGRKVQPQWLHDFLLNPHPIRPAVVLRMPKFNMSSAEAGALVNYFAAKDNVDYPYEYDPRSRQTLSAQDEARMKGALNIVTDATTYCVKCHKVGDYTPAGAVMAQSPQLDKVYERLRPEFLEKWIANPKRLLPYTAMPQLISPAKPADPKLAPGNSEEQIQALTDLLMNWPTFLQSRKENSIKAIVKEPTVPPAGGAAPGAPAPPAENKPKNDNKSKEDKAA
jgi:hypothetical protein